MARLISLEKRVAALEEGENHRIGGSDVMQIDTKNRLTEDEIICHIDDIGTQEAVVLALYMNAELTKAELQDILRMWGKAYGSWFEGGNFNNRLVKKGFIRSVGQSEGTDTRFALTGKGRKKAEETITKLRTSTVKRKRL
jgi:hypothetical protein